MIILGLTGSIGMGKSATAEMFRSEGVAVHDSDAAVHQLYRGAAVPSVQQMFPGAIVDGAVDRTKLAAEVLGDPAKLKALEMLIHPLVASARIEFIARRKAAGDLVCLVDIPLLFETGGEKDADLVVTCSAADHIQEQRVLARPAMTREKFLAIRKKQVPDEIKRQRSHFIIDTGHGFEFARMQVQALLRAITRT